MFEQSRIKDAKSIVILRANALGDLISSLPAFESIRHTYQKADITFLGKAWHVEFFTGRHNPFDHVIAIPDIAGLTIPEQAPYNKLSADTFISKMRQKHYDIAVQMHGGGRHSNIFIRSLEARMTVGAKAADAISLDRYIPYTFLQPEIFRTLEVASLIGAEPVSVTPHVNVEATDVLAAQKVIGKNDTPFLVLHPGASDKRRHWGVSKFAAVADYFTQKGYSVYIIGIAEEATIADTIIAKMQTSATNLAGKLSLSALIGLLSMTDLLIADDSGPLHLANAIGTPNIGLYWAPNYANYAAPQRSVNMPIVAWNTTCRSCGADLMQPIDPTAACQHTGSLLEEIQPEAVIDDAEHMLRLHTQQIQKNILDKTKHAH